MPGLSRVGDANSEGGKILSGASTVLCNGIPVGIHTSQISPHAPWGKRHGPHHAATTTDASPTVFADGQPVLRVGSGVTCGHAIVEGSSNVIVP